MTNYTKDDPATIRDMFDAISNHYDTANSIMSFQLHRLWNRKLVGLTTFDTHPKAILDLCAGTGEIAIQALKKQPSIETAYLLDFSPKMLEQAQEKMKGLVKNARVEYLVADAQEIPLQKDQVDLATIAYGIRNVKDPYRCFCETLRVLKPGGTFGILELTRPNNKALRLLHSFYLKNFLPLAGRFVTSNQAAYQYLSQSIEKFVCPKDLSQILSRAGFQSCQIHPLFGGIATVIVAKKSI